jgi:hypothetical protein
MLMRLLAAFALLLVQPVHSARQALVFGNDYYSSARVLF